MNIILYFLTTIQQLTQIIEWLLNFICRYIPLKQWVFDDSNSPKYQKFKVDELPKIKPFAQEWDWKDLISYYQQRYGKIIKPVRRRSGCDIPEDTCCPCCGAPVIYLYKNNGSKGQILCKVCNSHFSPSEGNRFKSLNLRCPHCGYSLVKIKDRKHFVIHKCINKKCPYYLRNLKKVDKSDLKEEHGKSKYKLHYIYREFVIDFFKMDLNSLPDNASSLNFTKFDSNVMSLCLTFRVNLQLSLRKTSQALKDLYNIRISHQQIANYCKTAATCIKPFVDNYDYNPGKTLVADETYIKVHGKKGYIWFIMDGLKRSILGYRASDNRGVGPCILAMRMAFKHFKEKLPEGFRFIADGYSAYPLASQQFYYKFGDDFKFDITKVIGLTNEDAVSKEFRSYKQMVERLNQTYKSSYRQTCGFDNMDGANYDLTLWVAYYNFLRPHKHKNFNVLNKVDLLQKADVMPDKWKMLIHLGQKTILHLQEQSTSNSCS